MNKATARPWVRRQFTEDSWRCWTIIGANGQGFAKTVGLTEETDEANAELIVRAVNSFDDLLAACKAALDYQFMDEFLADPSNEPGHVWAIRKEHLLAIRAAIAKAEKL